MNLEQSLLKVVAWDRNRIKIEAWCMLWYMPVISALGEWGCRIINLKSNSATEKNLISKDWSLRAHKQSNQQTKQWDFSSILAVVGLEVGGKRQGEPMRYCQVTTVPCATLMTFLGYDVKRVEGSCSPAIALSESKIDSQITGAPLLKEASVPDTCFQLLEIWPAMDQEQRKEALTLLQTRDTIYP